MIKVFCSFDDGSIYDVRTAGMLNQYGFDATFYIPVNWQRYLSIKRIDAMSMDDVKELSKRFTIGSHGVNHELLTRIDSRKQDVEIKDSLAYWQENGFDVDSFCYPRGYYTEEIKDKVKKAGYKSARTVKVGELMPPKDVFETHTTVHVGLDRKEYGTDWLEYARTKVKEAITRDKNGEDIEYRFFGHSEELHRYQQWERFGLFLRYLNEHIAT